MRRRQQRHAARRDHRQASAACRYLASHSTCFITFVPEATFGEIPNGNISAALSLRIVDREFLEQILSEMEST